MRDSSPQSQTQTDASHLPPKTKENRALFQFFLYFIRSHNLVFFLFWIIFLLDAGAEVEEEEAEPADEEDEQRARRNLKKRKMIREPEEI